MEKYISALGHELEIGNLIEWTTSGHTIIGRIIDFKDDKAIIQTSGCRYKTSK